MITTREIGTGSPDSCDESSDHFHASSSVSSAGQGKCHLNDSSIDYSNEDFCSDGSIRHD